jgi:hypothetical protein
MLKPQHCLNRIRNSRVMGWGAPTKVPQYKGQVPEGENRETFRCKPLSSVSGNLGMISQRQLHVKVSSGMYGRPETLRNNDTMSVHISES